jgi:hypothetical protein
MGEQVFALLLGLAVQEGQEATAGGEEEMVRHIQAAAAALPMLFQVLQSTPTPKGRTIHN